MSMRACVCERAKERRLFLVYLCALSFAYALSISLALPHSLSMPLSSSSSLTPSGGQNMCNTAASAAAA